MSRPGTPAPVPQGLLVGNDESAENPAPTVEATAQTAGPKTESLPADSQAENLQRLATLGTLAAGAAHEINHLITHLFSTLDRASRAAQAHVLAAKPPRTHEDELATALQQAHSCAARLRDLSRGMTECARPADGQPAVTQLNVVVGDALSLIGPILRQHARLDTTLERDLPALLGHPAKLTQVVVNLLVNAMHAVEDGDPTGAVVAIRTRQVRGALELVVADNGCGIEQADLQRALDPFFTTKPRDRGTGMGLALCRQIVEEHRGDIAIESQPGTGTTVTVTLPL